MTKLGKNIVFPIYRDVNGVPTPFHNLALHKSTSDSVVMSLGDKITGDVYYKNNALDVTMTEYILVKRNPDDVSEQAVKYVLVNPPTIVREGMAADNGQLKGMTKYSFAFYHPMYMLGNLPFADVAVTDDEKRYLSESKKFNWIGNAQDYVAKLNKNLQGTEFVVRISDTLYDEHGNPTEKITTLSDVLTFDDEMVADALKKFYDTYGIPFVIDILPSTDSDYASGKRYLILMGLPSETIVDGQGNEFVFRFGQGVGLKNNSRTPRNNKIVTRVAGYGSEENIPYGYPQIRWYGPSNWTNTKNDESDPTSYPIYEGIVDGELVKLIKHPFTRTHLMPSVYVETLFNKISPYVEGGNQNPDYDPDTTLVDYYDATAEGGYENPINPMAPSYESHEFADIKPQLGEETEIIDAIPQRWDEQQKTYVNDDHWDDTMDDDAQYVQSYFKLVLPQLSFDLYACAAITQQMDINMRSGACIGCTFPVQVDWEEYKKNFYTADGTFAPAGEQRDYTKYPDSSQETISILVKKENTTFGVLMPNIYQHPSGGDKIVFTGISLPESYITLAQVLLDDAMMYWMKENNVYYWDYPLKFDEDFLSRNTNILAQIRPNVAIKFQFYDITPTLYVKQLTIKYGEKVLPQYNITLTDNIEATSNAIGKAQADIDSFDAGLSRINKVVQDITRNERIKETGSTTLPVYINSNNEPKTITGLDVPEDIHSGNNIEAEGGVSAKGIADLSDNGEGGGGGGGASSASINGGVQYESDENGNIDIELELSELLPTGGIPKSYLESAVQISLGKADTALQSINSTMVVNALGFTPFDAASFTQANIKSTLGISNWALASTKPSYNFSEIGSQPTTLAGYGITDAASAADLETSVSVLSGSIGNLKASLGDIAYRSASEFLLLTDFSDSNIVSVLGNTPVNRTIGDKNGNDITTYYTTVGAFNTYKTSLIAGGHNIPVYIDSTGAHTIDSLSVYGDIQSNNGGVSANGIASLAINSSGGGGGVSSVCLGQGTNPYIPDANGLLTLPAYPVWDTLTGKPTLATVATSGSYGDLSGKPTDATTSASGFMSASDKIKLDGISYGATNVAESTVSGWGFTKNAGTVTSIQVKVASGAHITVDSASAVTTSGTYTLGIESGYSIPSDANQTTWSNKQDTISDLSTIRSNASNGNTAFGYFTDGKLNTAHMSAANIVAALGSTAVNRATADASGNTITSTYETKANVSEYISVLSGGLGVLHSQVTSLNDDVLLLMSSDVNMSNDDTADLYFVNGLTKDPYGNITAIRRPVREASILQSGLVSITAQTFAGDKTFADEIYGGKNIQADYGVSAKGIADLGASAGGGIGTVTSVQFKSDVVYDLNTPYIPNENGIVSLPAYPSSISDISGLQTALDSKLSTSLKGVASGLAELDLSGKVPSSQLPSYVDDVLEYDSMSNFPDTGEAGKIYVAKDTNKTYRWGGTTYVEISQSLALGTNHTTAFYGDYGQTAYNHATDSSRLTTAQASGLYKIAVTAQGHVASVTAVVKADITALGIPAQDTTYSNGTGLSLSNGVFSISSTYQTYISNGNTAFGYFTDGLLNKANHYTPASDSTSDYTASASGATASWSIDVVKAVQIQRDSKGHILGVTVTSGKIPAKPSYAFSDLTSHPTTLDGYGITDAATATDAAILSRGLGLASSQIAELHDNMALMMASDATVSDDEETKIRFIDDILKDPYGNITAVRRTVRDATALQSGVVSVSAQTFAGDKTFNDNVQSEKGVSAKGIADLGSNGGGGIGTVTSVQFKNNVTYALDTPYPPNENGLISLPAYPTKLSDLTNDAGFITGITSGMVTTALGYTPYNSSNPAGYTTNTGTVTSIQVKVSSGAHLIVDNTSAVSTSGSYTLGVESGYSIPSNTSQTAWTNKQDTIADLETIRGNASNGNTAYGYFSGGILKTANMSASNIVSALGTTAVNRATSDANGNTISSTYETKANVEAYIRTLTGGLGTLQGSLGTMAYRSSDEFVAYSDSKDLVQEFSSDSTNSIRLVFSGKEWNITQSSLRTSLGLGSAAYKSDTYFAYSVGETGTGNAYTGYTFAAGVLLLTKGSTFKTQQTAISDPTASGNAISFIDSISQDANGVITATKKTIYNASSLQAGIVTTGEQTFAGAKTFMGSVTAPTLTLNSTSAVSHLAFTGASTKYISFTNNQSLNVCPDGTASSSLAYSFTKNALLPIGSLYLGSTTNKWAGIFTTGIKSDAIYLREQSLETAIAILASGIGEVKEMMGSIASRSASEFVAYTDACDLMQGFSYTASSRTVSLIFSGKTWSTTIPLADASTIGLVSTSTQTFAGAKTFTGAVSLSSTLSVSGVASLTVLKMPNDNYISFKNTSSTDIRVVAMGGNNTFMLGNYQNVGTIPTNIYGSTVSAYVGATKKVDIDTVGLTSYGGVSAMGIADLSVN